MIFLKSFFSREVLIYSKKSSNVISPVIFFLICIAFFPLAISNDPNELSRLAPGLIWICILLAGMLSIQTIFKEDYDDGSLDLFYVRRFSMLQVVLIKIFEVAPLTQWFLCVLKEPICISDLHQPSWCELPVHLEVLA